MEILHLKNEFLALEIKHIWGLLRTLVKSSKLCQFLQFYTSGSLAFGRH